MAAQPVDQSRLPDTEEKSLGSPTKTDALLGRTQTASDSQVATKEEHDFSDIDVKKLDRRIDMTIIPWLSFLYLLSFLDRTAIGNARLFGMSPSLGLGTGPQYNIAVSIFFFPYALFEVPSNILLKRLSPPVWFSIACALVGIMMAAQGFTTNYGGLLATRFLLGVFEAALFPGANYLMSGWYVRSKFGLRAAIFFAAASASGAFGGLLSAGLAQIRGGMYDGPNDGWRWIFIVIGLVTVLSGIMSWWLVPNFPDKAKWLSEKERAFVIGRLQEGQQASAAGEGFAWRNVWKAVLDPKTALAMLAYMGCVGPLYAFSVFTPTIIRSLGSWSAVESNLLSVPIYIVAGIVTIAIGFLADRKGHRAMINLICYPIGILGYIILLAVDPRDAPGASYFAIYLAAMGIYPMIPNTIALCGSHIEGSYKRSVVLAMFIGFGNINGAATSQVYYAASSPRYFVGHSVLIAYLAIGWICSGLYLLTVKRENAARERGTRAETILDHLPHEEAVAEAQRIRDGEIAELKSKGGLGNKWLALKKSVHSAPGGTYASVQEAMRLKGDDYSGHRYSY